MKQNIREITHRFFTSFPLLTFGFIVFSVIALRFAHTSYAKPNPYLAYLDYTPDFISTLTTTCYGDPETPHIHNACTLHNEDGYTTFVFLDSGQMRSISFWRETEQAYVGDFVAWYGVPDKIYHTSRWTSYTWLLNGFRLNVQSREDHMYALVTMVVYGFR